MRTIEKKSARAKHIGVQLPNKQKHKVCFATIEYPPDIGGVSKSAQRVVNFLTQAGFDVHVFVPVYKNSVNYIPIIYEIIDDIKIYRVRCNNINPLDNIKKSMFEAIDQIDKKEKFNIFHGFFLYMAYPCIQVAQIKQRPVIASFRGIDAIWMLNPPYSFLAKEILQNTSWITSVSSESLKRANNIVNISTRSSFIFNSVVLTHSLKWKLSDENRKVVGTVSTFREKKNLPLLLDAYPKVDMNFRKNLLLVGEFIENKVLDYRRRTHFLKLAHYYGVEKEIIITGYVENSRVSHYLNAFNVFVLSSKHEGLPNAIMEAIAVGLPIVSTDVDGIKDILEDGENALLVSSGDEIGMKDAIEAILKDDKLALKLSNGAKELSQKLNPESEKKIWIDLYNYLLT